MYKPLIKEVFALLAFQQRQVEDRRKMIYVYVDDSNKEAVETELLTHLRDNTSLHATDLREAVIAIRGWYGVLFDVVHRPLSAATDRYTRYENIYPNVIFDVR